MTEKEKSTLCMKIMQNCKSHTQSRFPWLDMACAAVRYRGREDRRIQPAGTDGEELFLIPDRILELFGQDPEKMRRGYLHILFHCLNLHLFSAAGHERADWDLAADLACAYMICRLLGEEPDPCMKYLDDHGLVTAEQIYQEIRRGDFPFDVQAAARMAEFDSHFLWYNKTSDEIRDGRRRWTEILEYTSQKKRGKSKNPGTVSGDREEIMTVNGTGEYDYRSFLKRFAFPREEVQLDEESFDYIMYCYGLEHYVNLPLLEPLEYQEVSRLEELVIAIDTSGSCSRSTVQHFLEHTYSIVSGQENFFNRMNVWLIQCDCCIQSVQQITSREEWMEYCRQIRIEGRAGTDFRPVFRYVQELREKKILKNLKALIYFTDGDGVYPQEQTEYETAFVFLQKCEGMKKVPFWARALIAEKSAAGRGEGMKNEY